MKYKNEKKEECNREYITFESSLKENLKIQPVFTHIKLGQIY